MMGMQSMPSVVMYSLWRDDMDRQIAKRARHLVSKTYPNMRWIWVVGDSVDGTAEFLGDMACRLHFDEGLDVTVFEHETGCLDADHRSRLTRLSASCNVALDHVEARDDYVVAHESDLISPPDLIEQFLATGKDCVAGTTWLTLPNGEVFYDVWGFRRDGKRFTNRAPYHACWRDNELFQVDSFGSCWMMPAAPVVNGMRCYTDACRELCGKLARDYGAEFWCAPWIRIVQPLELWVPYNLTEAAMAREDWC